MDADTEQVANMQANVSSDFDDSCQVVITSQDETNLQFAKWLEA